MQKLAMRIFLLLMLVAGAIAGFVAGCDDKSAAPPPSKPGDQPVWSGPTTCFGGCEAKPASK